MNAPATTSAALVTSPARGGIAVIVLTGSGTTEIVREIFRSRSTSAPGVLGHLALGRIVSDEEVLDEAIVGCPAEDVAEINIHGGPHVARKVLSLLAERGARIVADCPVDPTLAAPKSGLDNPAIAREILSALRLTTTPLAASAVTCQWSAGLSALAALSQPEADRLRTAAEALPLMKRLLTPAEVVIAGPPNVGKSALANVLVGRNVSVVSETPGTTRDWVRTLADADGVPIWLTDTAGLWEEAEGIDAEAVRRAWKCVESADLVICVTAEAEPPADKYDDLVAHLRAMPNVLNVAGKCDVVKPAGRESLAVSAAAQTGIDSLRRAVRERLGFGNFDPTAPMAFTDRQADLLIAAADLLDRADLPGARSRLHDLLGK